MTSKVSYTGNLRTEAIHLKSGSRIETDAPVDNEGKGERFSPTDLVATALGSCMMTLMGIVANRHEWDLEGAYCEVEKIMATQPRRISAINVNLYLPASAPTHAKARKILEHAALTCPVFESLHPNCAKNISFHWATPDEVEANGTLEASL